MIAIWPSDVEVRMVHHRAHLVEKLEVQAAALVGVVAVYGWLWRLAEKPDPLAPVTFLPNGGYSGLVVVAGLFAVLSAVCGLLTVTARLEGAVLAALLGLGGLSLRSPSVESLLWRRQGDLAGMYGQMVAEIFFLGGVVLLGLAVAMAVRRLVGRARPGWLWRDPLTAESKAAPLMEFRPVLLRCLGCYGLAALIAAALVPLLMQSGDRGQIIFALLAGFAVATWIGHQAVPAPLGILAWFVAVAVGAAYCLLGGVWAVGGDWMKVGSQAQALPIDWVTAGGGGAMLGYWLSARMHEQRLLEHRDGELATEGR